MAYLYNNIVKTMCYHGHVAGNGPDELCQLGVIKTYVVVSLRKILLEAVDFIQMCQQVSRNRGFRDVP